MPDSDRIGDRRMGSSSGCAGSTSFSRRGHRSAWTLCIGAAVLASATMSAAAAHSPGIRMVGAGLPCTGTQSLVVALDMLGYKSCHGVFFWLNTTMRSRWTSYTHEGGDLGPALDSLLEQGYDATLDIPTVYAWQDLATRYPDSKVILTVRDSPEKWYASFASKLHFPEGGIAAGMKYVAWYYSLDFEGFFTFLAKNQQKIGCDFSVEQTPELRKSCIQGYVDHNEKVKGTVPADRLLVYNLKEGWEPLCKFLGVPVPKEAFPHRDITKGLTSDIFTDMRDEKLSMNFKPFLWFVPIYLVLLGCCCRCFCRCCCWCARGRSTQKSTNLKVE